MENLLEHHLMNIRCTVFNNLLAVIVLVLSVLGSFSLGLESSSPLPPCPGNRITSALMDSSGILWASTQGQGLFYLKLDERIWKKAGSPGDFPNTENFYALAEDAQGRIWVGTDRWGVCIWNGKQWKKYTHQTTLPGGRVFDISVSPKTGDVAVATSGGMAIYFPVTDSWKDITRADGLPEDQISSLSFDAAGDLWVGFSTAGMARLTLEDGYKAAEFLQSTWPPDDARGLAQPPVLFGAGLPSNLCNTVAVHHHSVLAGTTLGLGIKRGNRQIFIRGKDAVEKLKAKGVMNSSHGKLPPLPEDYITSLYPVKEGVWIGFRDQGAILFNPMNMQYKSSPDNQSAGKKKKNSVTCFVELPDGTVLAGVFGEGFRAVGKTTASKRQRRRLGDEARHPGILSVPSDREWQNSWKRFQSLPPGGKSYGIYFACDDWETQGDWCNRYGRHFSLRHSGKISWGDIMQRFDQGRDSRGYLYDATVTLGPRKRVKNAWISGKVHEENAPSRICLYNINDATRPYSEWSDERYLHGAFFDGPDLWVIVRVPSGKNEISLYFNQLMSSDISRDDRDYLIEARFAESRLPQDVLIGGNAVHGKPSGTLVDRELARIMALPVAARTRCRDFGNNGVYKNFYTDRPGFYFLRISGNGSKETALGGVFLNACQENSYQHVKMPSPPELVSIKISDVPENLINAWTNCFFKRADSPSHIHCSQQLLLYTFRKLWASPSAPVVLKENWKWHLKIWDENDIKGVERKMLEIWSMEQMRDSYYRSSYKFPNSPNVIDFTPQEIRMMDRWKVDWRQFITGTKQYNESNANKMRSRLNEYFNR